MKFATTSQDKILQTLQHFATKFYYFTNFIVSLETPAENQG